MVLHARLRDNSKVGTNLLKFIKRQLYNGKLAKRDGHARRMNVPYVTAPTLAHTSQESVRPTKTSLSAATTQHASSYSLHYATPQRAKAHSSANDLRIVVADAGNQNQTTVEEPTSLVTPPSSIGGPMPRTRDRLNLNGLARATPTGGRNSTPQTHGCLPRPEIRSSLTSADTTQRANSSTQP